MNRNTTEITKFGLTLTFAVSRPETFSQYQKLFMENFSPTKFELVGSNDCRKWETIFRVESTFWTTADQERKWHVPEEDRKLFTCIGFKVLANGR